MFIVIFGYKKFKFFPIEFYFWVIINLDLDRDGSRPDLYSVSMDPQHRLPPLVKLEYCKVCGFWAGPRTWTWWRRRRSARNGDSSCSRKSRRTGCAARPWRTTSPPTRSGAFCPGLCTWIRMDPSSWIRIRIQEGKKWPTVKTSLLNSQQWIQTGSYGDGFT